MTDFGEVIQRPDGSFVITKNGMPYHVPNGGEFTGLYQAVWDYVQEHPEMLIAEQPPEPPPFNPGIDYALIDDQWVKVKYSKKEFMLWCGVDKMTAVNAAISAGNVFVGTVKDLLMAADYIDIRDPDTIQMINLLATSQGGNILNQDDVERILAGQVYQSEESEE